MSNYLDGLEGEVLSKRKGNEEDRRLWEFLIEYVNAGSVTAFKSAIDEAFERLHCGEAAVTMCADYNARSSINELAQRYLNDMTVLFTWLAKPVNTQELQEDALEILTKYADDMKMFRIYGEYHPSNADSELFWEYPDACGTVIAPICHFIKLQIYRHDSGREDLRTVIPIGLCDREACGKFRMMKLHRPGRFFCSPLCRAKAHQAAKTKEERAEYMRGHRAIADRNKPSRKTASVNSGARSRHGNV